MSLRTHALPCITTSPVRRLLTLLVVLSGTSAAALPDQTSHAEFLDPFFHYQGDLFTSVYLPDNPSAPGTCSVGETTYVYEIFCWYTTYDLQLFELELDTTVVSSAGHLPGLRDPTMLTVEPSSVGWSFEPPNAIRSGDVASQLFVCSTAGPETVPARLADLVGPDAETTALGPVPADCHSEDFASLTLGDEIDGQLPGVLIGGSGPVVAFDSTDPTCADDDLLTPGPGTDNGVSRGMVLVLQETGSGCAPDDDRDGGVITIDYEVPTDVAWIGLLDVDEPGSIVRAWDASGELISEVDIPALDDNSWQRIGVGSLEVVSLEIVLAGSGAVTDIACSADARRFARRGDRVTPRPVRSPVRRRPLGDRRALAVQH
ncbi:MAG: hypothetical protein AAF533_30820 [Acidobacteriota bacterium]